VKEPLAPEYVLMREGQILYTYLHLAAVPELARVLVERQVSGVAYETIETEDGRLPLLQPMSAVAGRMAIQVGATFLEKERGGKGILLGGVAGVRRGRVAIIGGGVVGSNAARVAIGLGAQVSVLDVSVRTLEYLDDVYPGRIHTLYSDPHTIEEAVVSADLVIGAVLVAGARAPRLVTEAMVAKMEPGSVVVDVAVDQGGCIETASRPTTHDEPTYVVHGVVHYAVANMPGAVARTSTYALNNATISYGAKIADLGLVEAARADRALARGVNTYRGHVTHRAVATAVGSPFRAFAELL
jgi:alanine dehydrogenase